MGLVLKKVTSFPLYNIDIEFKEGINALYNNSDSRKLIDIIMRKAESKGEINLPKEDIFLVEKNLNKEFTMPTVKAYLNFAFKYYNAVNKKLTELIEELGIEKDFLDKKFNILSSSEEKLVQFILAFALDTKVLILEEPFIYLDKHNEKKIIKYLDKLKDKIIIILTNNSNNIYNYTDMTTVLYEYKLLCQKESKELLEDIKYLRKYKLNIPDTVLFTSKARNKKIDLKIHKDIRDLIKDVYRHV
ncbi:MAG: hypothetical protein IJH18_00390 [Bacilli bacterium]|nr:hypothetical protein [Bacilli bacterium]